MTSSISKRIAAIALAFVFTVTALFSVSAAPAYAATKPAQVKGLKAVAVSTSTSAIKLTWSKAKYASKYQVYRATSKTGKYKKVATVKKLTYTAKGLKANKKYFYKVRAIKGSKKGKFSAIKAAKTHSAKSVIVVDKNAGSVTITAKVDGTFFNQSTMHCVVTKSGGAGSKAMLQAYCDSQYFYNAMVAIGGTPWNTTSARLKDGEFTGGESVDITLQWDGQDTPVALVDALKTDDGKPEIDMRFSGNKIGNKKAGSGCIACLNSCWAGICSNAAYAFGAIDAGNPCVYMDESVMPADGTDVKVTFTLK